MAKPILHNNTFILYNIKGKKSRKLLTLSVLFLILYWIKRKNQNFVFSYVLYLLFKNIKSYY